MNCKPGDLAVLVRAAVAPELVGVFVTVTRPSKQIGGAFHWHAEPTRFDSNGHEWVYPDDCLRPIRDPGDNAVDEVLQRIPSPFTTQPERTEA